MLIPLLATTQDRICWWKLLESPTFYKTWHLWLVTIDCPVNVAKKLYQEVQKYFLVGKREVQNGRQYIRYRSSSQENEAEERKKLTDNFPYLANPKSTLYVPLTINKVEKTKYENFGFVNPLFRFIPHEA